MYLNISPRIPAGELPVAFNPGSGDPFGVIKLGDADITVHTDDDARRLIAAAARLIAMRAMLGIPHPFSDAEDDASGVRRGWCTACGMLDDWPDHDEPAITLVPGTLRAVTA